MAIDPKLLEIAAADDEVQERAKRFANALLDQAEQLLAYGTPQIKLGLIRAGIGVMMRNIKEVDTEQATIDTLRAEVRSLMVEVRGGTNVQSEDNPENMPPEDAPPIA